MLFIPSNDILILQLCQCKPSKSKPTANLLQKGLATLDDKCLPLNNTQLLLNSIECTNEWQQWVFLIEFLIGIHVAWLFNMSDNMISWRFQYDRIDMTQKRGSEDWQKEIMQIWSRTIFSRSTLVKDGLKRANQAQNGLQTKIKEETERRKKSYECWLWVDLSTMDVTW
jgi:hypothetical protein